MVVAEAVKGSKVKLVLTSLVTTATDFVLVAVTPNPKSELAVNTVVEFDGTMNWHPLVPVVHLAPYQ